MEGAREGHRGGARTEKGRVKIGNIGILGQRQVTPRWEDDTVQRNYGHQRRGCRVRRGLPPPAPEGNHISEREGRAGQE